MALRNSFCLLFGIRKQRLSPFEKRLDNETVSSRSPVICRFVFIISDFFRLIRQRTFTSIGEHPSRYEY